MATNEGKHRMLHTASFQHAVPWHVQITCSLCPTADICTSMYRLYIICYTNLHLIYLFTTDFV